MAGAGDRGGGLDQQRRFADARIAAHQQHGAAHESAAGDPVELRESGRRARGIVCGAGKRMEHERPPLAIRLAGAGRHRRFARLLRDGVPRAAGIALALPAAKHGAAVLADEAGGVAGHGCGTNRFAIFSNVACLRI